MAGASSGGAVRGDAVAQAFEEQRGRLTAVAERVLGSRADAEDAVQEAWIRLSRQDAAAIENLAGWLTTVVSRVCIDVLRARRTRPERPLDTAPEWVVTEVDDGPEADAVLADSVGTALLVVLDTLSPDERLAFVLHDVFGMPFAEIGSIVEKSADATKMAASRARNKVRGAEAPVDRRRQRAVVDAFLAAARGGDVEGLLRVLHPDLMWTVHNARRDVVRRGTAVLVEQARRGVGTELDVRSAWVDGLPGLVVRSADGRPFAVMACTVEDDRIVEIHSVTDPARLAAMNLGARSA
ncbi:sigma-70 family RNA polymerase sigma factor [Cellulomonas sp. HZM]|uniref:sigma-70 family RNA polymerase sigma factor n=1 Tax=Cellulomonas sp. HZM TaxID=1454010 RepID=UPI0018CC541C|nr:sigma-70 family RNA polymerase sigma factor [Cellulomonas sp. HZM]